MDEKKPKYLMRDKIQVGVLLISVAGLFFWIGYYSGNQRVESLRDKLSAYSLADDAKLKDLSISIRESASTLSKYIGKLEANENLIRDRDSFKREMSSLKAENAELQKKIDAKDQILKGINISHDNIVLRENEVKYLFGDQVILSLKTVYYTSVKLLINNNVKDLELGEYHNISMHDGDIRIILEKVEYKYDNNPSTARFSIIKKSNIAKQGAVH